MTTDEILLPTYNDLPLLTMEQGGRDRKGIMWRYWNGSLDGMGHAPSKPGMATTGIGIYIIAVVNERNGELFDWAAYIGASLDGTWQERSGLRHVMSYGDKMGRREALAFFPDLADIAYRE